MKTLLLATLLPCILATQQLNAQPIGIPYTPSSIISGTISGSVYDVTLRDGTRQTGNYHSRLDDKGNGSIVSWPDGGSVTITRVKDGNAVIFGPSR
jgi:hypothetical protein